MIFLKDPIVEETYKRLSDAVEIVTDYDHRQMPAGCL